MLQPRSLRRLTPSSALCESLAAAGLAWGARGRIVELLKTFVPIRQAQEFINALTWWAVLMLLAMQVMLVNGIAQGTAGLTAFGSFNVDHQPVNGEAWRFPCRT